MPPRLTFGRLRTSDVSFLQERRSGEGDEKMPGGWTGPGSGSPSEGLRREGSYWRGDEARVSKEQEPMAPSSEQLTGKEEVTTMPRLFVWHWG
jgi:hypothetical protein